MIRAGIIGGAGYTAGELLRLLLNHPEVNVTWIHSTSSAGKPVTDIHAGLIGDTDLVFSDSHDLEAVDVVFMCSGHGQSSSFWQDNTLPENTKVIDLAQDFRDETNGYVYGLPELHKQRIAKADKTANPGCFATAMQLALLPLAAAHMLDDDIVVNGITGSTGAGVKPAATTHFSWRTDNLSVYKAFTHQHIPEVRRSLETAAEKPIPAISFIPIRGDFARGILLTAVTDCNITQQQAETIYQDYYSDAAFTHVVSQVDLKQVVNTNKCLVSVTVHDNKLLATAVIDNLLKGASGQAVQNMNIMFGLDEKTGLHIKPSAF